MISPCPILTSTGDETQPTPAWMCVRPIVHLLACLLFHFLLVVHLLLLIHILVCPTVCKYFCTVYVLLLEVRDRKTTETSTPSDTSDVWCRLCHWKS